MFSKYDSMSNEELRKTSDAEHGVQAQGTRLDRDKRVKIHQQLLDDNTPGYSRYSCPPDRLTCEWSEEEMAHWLPELFALYGTELQVHSYKRQMGETGSSADNFSIRAKSDMLVSFRYTYWPGCCALAMVSRLEASNNVLLNLNGCADMISKRILPILRNLICVHQVFFSYSDEEVDYQDRLWKSWGGVDIQTPFDSYKTGNAIHTAALDLANSYDIIDARSRREAHDAIVAEYDGELEEDF